MIEPRHRRVEAPHGDVTTIAECAKLFRIAEDAMRYGRIFAGSARRLVSVQALDEGLGIDHGQHVRLFYRAVNGNLTANRASRCPLILAPWK